MIVYVLDTCVFRELLEHLPKKGSYFEQIWEKLEKCFKNGTCISVDECFNELIRK